MTAEDPTPTTAAEEHSTRGAYVAIGESFDRDMNYIDDRITRDGRDGWPVEAGRYRLVAARACPWANRTLISRRLLGLETALSVGMPGPTHDKRSWTFDLDEGGVDPVLGYERLQQAYFARFPDYPRGITVPAVVDVPSRAVVTNDFQQITLDFATEWTAHHREGAPDLYPEAQREEIDASRWMLHHEQRRLQDRLRVAVTVPRPVGGARRLGRLGHPIPHGPDAEADVRLFPDRFDPVYHGHFKANRQTLATCEPVEPPRTCSPRDSGTSTSHRSSAILLRARGHQPRRWCRWAGPQPRSGADHDRFDTDTWGPQGSSGAHLAAEVVDPAHTPLHVTGR